MELHDLAIPNKNCSYVKKNILFKYDGLNILGSIVVSIPAGEPFDATTRDVAGHRRDIEN
jgi:hypothetical protein